MEWPQKQNYSWQESEEGMNEKKKKRKQNDGRIAWGEKN